MHEHGAIGEDEVDVIHPSSMSNGSRWRCCSRARTAERRSHGDRANRCAPSRGGQDWSVSPLSDRRASLWRYYDRRDYEGGVAGAFRYFRNLGVEVTPEAINEELREITRQLARLPPTTFVDVGAG